MNLPAYPKTKKSGTGWLGDVPEHWEVRRLKFAIRTNPVKSEIVEVSGDSLVSFVPMDAVGEYGGMNLEKEKMVDEVYTGYTYFADGDVVIAKITPCFENGKGAIAAGLKNGIGFGTTEFHVLRAEKSCDRRFLFYLTISHPFRKIGASEMLGAGGQKRVPEDFIKNLTLGMPPVSEQRAIAEFLDRKTEQIDELIGKKKELIQKLTEQRSALITAAVTGKLQSEIGNPQSSMRHSGVEWLGEIPEHWEARRLKFLGDFRSGENITTLELDDNGAYPVYGGNGLRGYADRYTHEGERILIGRQGAHCGNIHLVKGKFWASEHAVVVTPVTKYNAFWLMQVLRMMNLNQYSVSAAQPGLSVDQVKNLSIPAPPVSEQNAIAEYLDEKTGKIDGLIKKTEAAIQTLEEYRTALITAAVTGKIKVQLNLQYEAIESQQLLAAEDGVSYQVNDDKK